VANSTIQLQFLVDDAQSQAELAPALATGGYSDSPALSIANDVMRAMIAGGKDGQPFNFKFNRLNDPTFFTNSWQQDYFVPGLVNLGWLESCSAVNFSCTGFPKPVRVVEVRRDLLVTSSQNANVGKICWMQNDTMLTGVWGQSQQASQMGLQNPGPGAVYTDPSTALQQPLNPVTAIKDSFSNLWVLTTYGTCGNTNPFLSNQNPTNQYPTFQSPTTSPITVTDGTVVWTAINPKGQGFRLNPRPGQTGPVWMIQPVAQNRIPMITTLSQVLDPIPDDYYPFFKQGFFAQCYRRSPDPKVRAKFEQEWTLWLRDLDNAVRQSAREMDDWGFVPSQSIMASGYAVNTVTPSQPYGPWAY
jgi:hypothetical protein